jgi:hypothetical protein
MCGGAVMTNQTFELDHLLILRAFMQFGFVCFCFDGESCDFEKKKFVLKWFGLN